MGTLRTTDGARGAYVATLTHARVQLAVRQEGSRLHVVAVCSARHAPAVRRALTIAAVALQMNGLSAVTTTRIGVRA